MILQKLKKLSAIVAVAILPTACINDMGDGGPDRKGTGEGTIRSSFSISLQTARDVATRSTGHPARCSIC